MKWLLTCPSDGPNGGDGEALPAPMNVRRKPLTCLAAILKLLQNDSQATSGQLHFSRSQCLPSSHLREQPGCLSLQKWKQDSEDTRREEFRRSPRVECPPSFSRVRVYFARPITLAEIRGYSKSWTVTLLLDSLADTIAFSFNKFIILCAMCNYVTDWIRKNFFSKIT